MALWTYGPVHAMDLWTCPCNGPMDLSMRWAYGPSEVWTYGPAHALDLRTYGPFDLWARGPVHAMDLWID